MKFQAKLCFTAVALIVFTAPTSGVVRADVFPPNPFSNRLERVGAPGVIASEDLATTSAATVGAVNVFVVGLVSTPKKTLVTFDLGDGRLFTAELGERINDEYKLLSIDDSYVRIERLSDEVQFAIDIFGSMSN